MSKFVKLHQEKDEVYVNLDYVAMIDFSSTDNCTYVHFCSGKSIGVNESFEQILKILKL